MRHHFVRLIAAAAAAFASLCLAAFAQARSVTLAFDAVYQHAKIVDAAPAGDSVGDRQVVSGFLRDTLGNRVGKFSFVCRYVTIVAGDAHEHCTGSGGSADGAIRFSGPAVKSDQNHTWSFTGISGALKGAHGHGIVHDATQHASIAVLRLSLPSQVRLPDGVVPRSPVNGPFIRNASRACDRARTGFAHRPPFPLMSFDPLHPTAAQLRTVGKYFSGPGDGRPIERRLLRSLDRLGSPPVGKSLWRGYISALKRVIGNQTRQTNTALQANIPAFVASVHAGDTVAEALSFAARAFGTPRCDQTAT